jgi:hypothetical protein
MISDMDMCQLELTFRLVSCESGWDRASPVAQVRECTQHLHTLLPDLTKRFIDLFQYNSDSLYRGTVKDTFLDPYRG